MARPQLQDEVTQISGTLKWITGPKFIKKNMSRNPQICHPKFNHPMNDFSKLFFFPSPDWPTHAADAECMGWGGQGGRFGSVSHGNDEQKRDIVGKNHVFSIFKVTQKRIQNFSGSWTYCSIIFFGGHYSPKLGERHRIYGHLRCVNRETDDKALDFRGTPSLNRPRWGFHLDRFDPQRVVRVPA
jgi:hypothetical protein